TDGGTNWSITQPSPSTLSVFFINPQIGWRVGDVFEKTTNGGDFWTNQYSSFTNDYFIQVDFVDEKKGWIISPTSIYHTGNAGDSWQLQKTVQNGSLNYLYAVDSLNCWVVGYDWSTSSSLILNTTDGGNLWERRQVAYTSRLNSACFVDKNIGWIVGDSGLILFTEDSGQNWLPQESGVSAPLNSVDFINSDYGWIAGYNSVSMILFTEDGGQNWSTVIQDSLKILKSIEFVDSLEGWGVGGYCAGWVYCSGYIYHTSDGGITWELQHSGWGKYSSIKFINEDIGWVTGGGGFVSERVLKTIDGGENWIEQNIPITWTNGIDFVDSNNGWLVGEWGLIMHTSNGGITFIEEPVEIITQTKMNFTLYHNYPNPFNPNTKIKYSVPQSSQVIIKVFDILGNEIETLVNEEKPSGYYELEFNASKLASGIYFYRIQAGSVVETKKMVLMK
ncbi:MAG: YCF48-related protein, partial [Ignavibacteriaceae bacterium]